MFKSTTFQVIFAATLVLLILLWRVAIREQLWPEFYISAAQILACSISLLFLLREDR